MNPPPWIASPGFSTADIAIHRPQDEGKQPRTSCSERAIIGGSASMLNFNSAQAHGFIVRAKKLLKTHTHTPYSGKSHLTLSRRNPIEI